jgi:nucleotide-binding universal stress UspA family protein
MSTADVRSRMTERILVPIDGSEPSTEALDYAMDTYSDARVTALHVIPVPEGYWAAFGDPEKEIPGYDRAREHATEVLDDARETAAERGREIDTETLTGRPERAIVNHAEEGGFNAIVIASHGRDGISRLLLGSVTETVVRRSPVPVVVVR